MMLKKGFAASIILMIFLFSVSAFAGGTVVAIDVKGNSQISTETIFATLKTKKGSAFDRATVKNDIAALWKLGFFSDVQVEKNDVGGQVALVYIVKEKPVITKISFVGNKKIKKDDLAKDVSVVTYKPLDEKRLAESISKIKEAYAKKGYYLADVDYRIEPLEGNEAELILDINERQSATIRKVEFIGNHAYKDSELRKIIKTREKTAFSWIYGGGKFKKDVLETDVKMLMFHYLQNGYLKIKVDNPKVAISKDRRYIYVTFTIEEGKQYKVGDINVDGDILTTKEELKSLIKLKPNTIYNQRTVEEDIMRLTDFYGESGYAFVFIRPDVEPNDDTLVAPVTFMINKGNQIKIEKINISGNTITRDKVIRREMRVKEGDIYNTRLVNLSKEKIQQLGFFEEVNFATPRGSRDDTLILNITVKEKPTGTFNVGAGFSTSENFIFSASIAKENFFGYGIGGQISAELSKLRQQFMLEFHDPYFLDSEWMLSSSLYRTVFSFNDFDRRAYGGSLSVGHRFFENCSMSVGYQIEDVKVSDFSYTVPSFFKQNASGITSEMILTVENDTRDNKLFPTKGMYHAVVNEYSGSKLGGTNDFYRVSGNSRFFYPIYKGIVAKLNGKIGYIKSLGDTSVPLFERYFTGGPYSLRGFLPREIGPSLQIPSSPTGADSRFVYGGNKLLLFNAEVELPIYEPAGVKWVFFLDAGNAFAETENYSLTNLRTDWGFGLRWNSPIGPLRFEWGLPFKREPGEDAVVFNFTIGSLF